MEGDPGPAARGGRRPSPAGVSPKAAGCAEWGRKVIFTVGISAVGDYLPAMRTVIYPGSFDPVTNGHLDLIHRAAHLFDHVVVAVALSESKHPFFTLAERVALVSKAIAHLPNVTSDTFDGLLVDYVERKKGHAVMRGLRAVSDFEFEFQLALMNRKLNDRIETIFMMPKEAYVFLSSRAVKEIAGLGGDVSAFVPGHVRAALKQKLAGAVQA
jgi:pantetheine-phosphate adenylyltransferase